MNDRFNHPENALPHPPATSFGRVGVWAALGIVAIAAVWVVSGGDSGGNFGGASGGHSGGDSGGHSGGDLVAWRADHDASMTQAAADGQPALVLFTADWCPPCQQMKKYVFSDPTVATLIGERFVPIKVDMTDSGDRAAEALANRYRLRGVPTLVVLDPTGKELDRRHGMEADDLKRWLTALADATQRAQNGSTARLP